MNYRLIGIILVIFMMCISAVSSLNQINKEKKSWIQVNKDGFGDKYNIAPRGVCVFNDTLLVGTGKVDIYNGSYGDLFQGGSIRNIINDLISRSQKKRYINKGCEIWGYKNNKWTCFVGKNGINPGGFGDNNTSQVGFLIEYKGFLYAGLMNQQRGCEIWKTNDLKNWQNVVECGYGNVENFWAMTAIVFKNELYVGTGNWNKSEIYKTNNGENWTQVVGDDSITPAGFGMDDNFYIWSMCVYNSNLYVGTAYSKGCDIWTTDDGLNWEPLVAYNSYFKAKRNGADHQRGFGKYWVGCARNMLVFNNELYIFSAVRGYVRLVVDAFGREIFDFDFVLPDFKYPSFNLVPRSGQIWRYNDTTNKWNRVIGGWGKTSNSAGFGDRLNQYLWAVSKYDGKVYVGTLNIDPTTLRLERIGFLNYKLSVDLPTGNAEIWATSDGDNWMQVNEDGFGDKYNLAIREMEEFDGCLYACTANVNSGCEVWQLN